LDVAVRSSATAEDLPDASFAGQQETYLNVQGHAALLETCRRCFASLFTDRAISYRTEKGFDHFKVALSIGVQRMVRSDLAASGVMFSIDTETGFRDAVLINAALRPRRECGPGCRESRRILRLQANAPEGFRPSCRNTSAARNSNWSMTWVAARWSRTFPYRPATGSGSAISDDEILTLARWACMIEDHYSAKRGRPTPMDMEWAKDGVTGELFILQGSSRNGAVAEASRRHRNSIDSSRRDAVLTSGRSVGEKIATGRVRVIEKVQDLHYGGKGGRAGHRQDRPGLGANDEKSLRCDRHQSRRPHLPRRHRQPRTWPARHRGHGKRHGDAAHRTAGDRLLRRGRNGRVYEGAFAIRSRTIDLRDATPAADQDHDERRQSGRGVSPVDLPNDGVGLAREEFIITTFVKIHPLALLDYDRLKIRWPRPRSTGSPSAYEDKPKFFVDKLAQGVAMIAAAFLSQGRDRPAQRFQDQ
jgi:pyruvate, water dikinase